jgi:hypothetical protein
MGENKLKASIGPDVFLYWKCISLLKAIFKMKIVNIVPLGVTWMSFIFS